MARTMSVVVNIARPSAVYTKKRSDHRNGGRKVVREETSGDDFHHTTGKWNVVHRVIDHETDWYEKTYKDRETGEIVYKTAHPLSQHQGHGSAKRVKRPPQSD
jgi:hypothetical protein